MLTIELNEAHFVVGLLNVMRAPATRKLITVVGNRYNSLIKMDVW